MVDKGIRMTFGVHKYNVLSRHKGTHMYNVRKILL